MGARGRHAKRIVADGNNVGVPRHYLVLHLYRSRMVSKRMIANFKTATDDAEIVS